MALAIFDLDNTLLDGDSDYLWGEFLVENNIVNNTYHRKNIYFYEQYLAGTMDILEFLIFQLEPLSNNSPENLHKWRELYLQNKIDPIILQAGQELIASHKKQGDKILIITATNSFIATPIAKKLKIFNLISTEVEFIDGSYTGIITGIPSYHGGKVIHLNKWLECRHYDLKGSYFYSDSHNDISLLNLVDHPVVVDADPKLESIAINLGWKISSFRHI